MEKNARFNAPLPIFLSKFSCNVILPFEILPGEFDYLN